MKARSILRAAWLAAVLAAAGCGRLDPQAELAAAADSLAAGDYGDASIRLNNVVQVDPDNAEARRLRGELALLLGDYAGAAEELDRARMLGAALDTVALGLAEAWTALQRPERALEILDAAAPSLDDDPVYWTIRAEALLRAGRTDDAEQALESAERAGEGGTRARIARARLAFARNDFAAAEEILRQVVSAAPDEPLPLRARAELFARTGRLDEAAADLLHAADLYRVASLRRHEVTTLLALVQVNLARNDLDGAEAVAERLTERAPQAALTAYFRGLVEYRRGNLDEAAALIQPIVNASPDVIQFRSLLGAIHLARGDLGQAEQQFRMVLAESPGDPAAVKLLAETHLRQRRPEAALSVLKAVEDAAAEDPQIGLLSGIANLLTGDTEQGLLYLQQAVSLDPANELLKLHLARAYLAAGRDADASAVLEDTLGGGPAELEADLLRLFADVRAGGPGAANAEAAELLAEFPRDPRALTGVAVYYQLQGETERARELFEQAAKFETEGATARLFLAAALVQEGRSQDAERLLEQVVEEQPENAQALSALAELLTARQAFGEAAALLRRAADHSASISPRLMLAQLLIRQGDLTAAAREIDVAAKAAPESAEVVAVRGLLAFAEGRVDEATKLLQQAESQLPNRLGVSLALARAQLAGGQPAAARDTLRRVLAVAPRSLPLRLVLGDAELALGNAAEALSIASALKAEYPAQSGGYLLEAEALIATRRYAAAASTLTAAFDLEPTWPVLTRLIAALQLAGRPDEALQAAEEWSAANPNHVPGRLALAGLLQNDERYDEALRAYEGVLDLEASNLIALNNAAWLSHELARPEALTLAERAYELAPDNPAVLDTLGWILFSEDRAQEAIEHLSRAAELAPQVPEIRYHFAQALAALGRSAEARS
ncbi:MAG TPA: XrtA/PEP-CTERM system TPR-repeat protein PrsT, partial [Gammaproteobacteria bacterium]